MSAFLLTVPTYIVMCDDFPSSYIKGGSVAVVCMLILRSIAGV